MIDWKRSVTAGLVAGLVFVVMEMALVALALGGSPWGPPRMMAAIALGQEVLPPPATFDAGITVAGLIVHFVLSAVYGVLFALAIQRFSTWAGVAVGAGLGLLLYVVNFYGFTVLFPWFANARNWVTIVSHLVFGAVVGWVYVAGRGRRTEARAQRRGAGGEAGAPGGRA